MYSEFKWLGVCFVTSRALFVDTNILEFFGTNFSYASFLIMYSIILLVGSEILFYIVNHIPKANSFF